jgi:hypothetical protein
MTGCSSGNFSLPSSQAGVENGGPFGAVAYSGSTGKWQIVSDLPSSSVARTKALSGCAADDCKVLAQFRRGECASLSLDAAGVTREPYVSIANEAGAAMKLARDSCTAGGGQNCKVSSAICN